uniref:Uncharacterized protein n=1 Tax=Anopheles melas TaxID=34690 RepID=A0A182UDA4_9DIPT
TAIDASSAWRKSVNELLIVTLINCGTGLAGAGCALSIRKPAGGWSGVTGATYIILGQCAKDGQVVDPYRALERVAQASLGDRHAGPNGGRLFRRVTSADTCHGQGKFLRYQNTRLHRLKFHLPQWGFGGEGFIASQMR